MTVDQLLTMIETVDPSDRAALDEIDMRVYQYLNSDDIWPVTYTRSRNALKAARPFGTWASMWATGTKIKFRIGSLGSAIVFDSPYLTEELAELHAIIQAIRHDRAARV